MGIKTNVVLGILGLIAAASIFENSIRQGFEKGDEPSRDRVISKEDLQKLPNIDIDPKYKTRKERLVDELLGEERIPVYRSKYSEKDGVGRIEYANGSYRTFETIEIREGVEKYYEEFHHSPDNENPNVILDLQNLRKIGSTYHLDYPARVELMGLFGMTQGLTDESLEFTKRNGTKRCNYRSQGDFEIDVSQVADENIEMLSEIDTDANLILTVGEIYDYRVDLMKFYCQSDD
jgi:hypothetical protein